MATIEELQAERDRIDAEIAAITAQQFPDWALFLLERLPPGGHCMTSDSKLDLDRRAVGAGCPEYAYGHPGFISFTGSSGPGFIVFLRALLALEEHREAERAAKGGE